MLVFRVLVLLALVVPIPAMAENLPGCVKVPGQTCPAGLSRPRIVCVHAAPEKSVETVAELPYDSSTDLAALCGPEASVLIKWTPKTVHGLPAPEALDEGGSH
jgi:hypothetical protein